MPLVKDWIAYSVVGYATAVSGKCPCEGSKSGGGNQHRGRAGANLITLIRKRGWQAQR